MTRRLRGLGTIDPNSIDAPTADESVGRRRLGGIDRQKYSLLSTLFDGVSKYAQVVPLDASINGLSTAITVSIWVRLPASGGFDTILHSGFSSQLAWTIQRAGPGGALPNSFWTVEVYEPGGLLKRYRISFPTFVDAGWHHLAFTYIAGSPDGTLRIYFDGVEDTTPLKILDALVPSLRIPTITQLTFGSLIGVVSFLNGNEDSVTIWGSTFGLSQVRELYAMGKPADPKTHSAVVALKGHWRMGDGDTHPVIKEQVTGGAGFDATLFNSVPSDFRLDSPP